MCSESQEKAGVAPFRGAWIEIAGFIQTLKAGTSLPLGERGLKLLGNLLRCSFYPSLPLGERGLKFVKSSFAITIGVPSLPLGERGLK